MSKTVCLSEWSSRGWLAKMIGSTAECVLTGSSERRLMFCAKNVQRLLFSSNFFSVTNLADFLYVLLIFGLHIFILQSEV